MFTQSKIMSHNSATMPARLGFEVSLGNSRHAAPRVKGPSLERQENTELTDRKDRRQRDVFPSETHPFFMLRDHGMKGRVRIPG